MSVPAGRIVAVTTTSGHRQRGFLLSLLTLLTLLGAILATPVDASASTRAAAETRVRANDTPTTALVAARDLGSSTVAGVSDVRLRQEASATGVATNSADDVAGLADEAFGAGDAMAFRYLKAMSDSPVDIPQGWAPRVADNGNGVVFQRPGATGNADMIRVDDSGAAATTSRRTHDIDEQRRSERTRTRPR